ncbi:MAG: IS1634 family transposase [Promethearchaeota archaeon]
MVYITRKKKKGKYYLYLEESAWIDGKSKRVWQKYLGPEDRIKDAKISGLLSKNAENVELETMGFGVSAALWVIAEKIGISKIIDNFMDKSRKRNITTGEYFTIAAINRCAAPCSKSKLGRWFANDWLSTRYALKPEILNAQTYWNQFHRFTNDDGDEVESGEENENEKEAKPVTDLINDIELAINKAIMEKYDLDLQSLFFDPTNFFTFSRGSKNSLADYGNSKEGRYGLRIINLSLLCTGIHGIPLMHETYPGNEQDAKRFKGVPGRIDTRLEALGREAGSFTLVFDKGNHSPEAFKIIDEKHMKFIASARGSSHKDLLHVPRAKLTKLTLQHTGKPVEYFQTTRKIYGKDRTVYMVLDPAKQRKHIILFKAKIDEKVEKIKEYFKDRLNLKKWKKREAVEKKLKSMIGKKPFADVLVATVTGGDGNMTLATKIDKVAKAKHEETLGRSIIFTNRDDWTAESVIWGYREQYVVEHAFKYIKNPGSIAIRPMYHHADTCIRFHVFTCFLAYLLLSLLRLELAKKKVQATYSEIIETLNEVHLNKISLSSRSPKIYKLDKTAGLAVKIIRSLQLKQLVP